jgi:hypothetical protein
MPAFIIARLWRDAPFSRPLNPTLNSVLIFGTTTTLAVFFSYVAKWFVLCEPGWLGERGLALLGSAAALPGGSVCPSSAL